MSISGMMELVFFSYTSTSLCLNYQLFVHWSKGIIERANV